MARGGAAALLASLCIFALFTTGSRGQGTMRVECLGLPRLLRPLLRPLFRTNSVQDVDVRFRISSRERRSPVELRVDDLVKRPPAILSPLRPSVVLVHGFLSSAKEQWVTDMADALLDEEDVNVLAVDWSGGADTWRYWRAVANARVASTEVTRALRRLRGHIDPHRLHCVGHSLGAHVCAFVAKRLGGIARVTGLDPAQPCFRPTDEAMRLSRADAVFVDVIHTNGRPLRNFGLGLPEPIGHADFYPNGGMYQPGCSAIGSIFIPRAVQDAVCSHGRAYMFFTESIRGNCSFWGRQWDRRDESVDVALASPCSLARCSEMGLRTAQWPATGSFYVRTGEQSPYCMQTPDLDRHMRNLLASSNAIFRRSVGA